jgi:multimeric flavodoxin WrbA
MKISIINGSQKTGQSNSGIILDWLNKRIKNDHEVKNYKLRMKLFTEEIYSEIISGDVIVLAFPLYRNSIPANTLKMLIELEKILKEKRQKK